nr:MAG: hypothetical protein [Microvirus sp.]
MLKTVLVDNFVKPALRRLGTAGATALVLGGDWLCANVNACGLVTEDGAAQVMTYVTAVALLCIDLAAEWVHKRKQQGG